MHVRAFHYSTANLPPTATEQRKIIELGKRIDLYRKNFDVSDAKIGSSKMNDILDRCVNWIVSSLVFETTDAADLQKNVISK